MIKFKKSSRVEVKSVISKVGVIIPAAGSGSRMGNVYKPLEEVCDRPMLCYSIETFEKCPEVSFIVICARDDKIEEIECLCRERKYEKVKKVICGGKDRQESVALAFECGLFDDDSVNYVAVHDAARPLLTVNMAKKVFEEAFKKKSAVCASRVRDTVRRTDETMRVCATVERDNLWLIQTPQVFEKDMYRSALENARKKGYVATDDGSLVFENGKDVNLCETASFNIKVTYPEDMILASALINYYKKRGEDI